MAGGNPPKPSSKKPTTSSSAASHRKSRWESPGKHPAGAASGSGDPKSKPSPKPTKDTPNTTTNKPPNSKPISNPSPKPDPSTHSTLPPFPFREPPPPPAYGFHMLERRTIVLADGSARSYFSLPPDYQDFPSFRRPEPGLGFDRQFPMSPDFRPDEGMLRNRNQEYWNSLGLEGGRGPGMGSGNESAMKRKFGDDGKDGFERQRQQVLEHGNASGNYLGREGASEMRPAKYMRSGGFEGNVGRVKHNDVDQSALRKSFLSMVKLIFENPSHKRSYLADGKQGRLQCLACNRMSSEFPDIHALIMHSYNSDSADSLVGHLAFHKALCVLMGWNYLVPPDNSKSYQRLSADEAVANQDDLILWPPLVIIHNTITGKRANGQMDGLGNRAMDTYLKDIGFHGGKSKSLYGRDGHLGITLIKYASDQSGLMEASRLAEYFERDNRGRKGWARLLPLNLGLDDENNNDLVKVDHKTGEKKRVFYGYLGTISDLDVVDFETRKKVSVESRRDYKPSS